jgi:hypothetical protein
MDVVTKRIERVDSRVENIDQGLTKRHEEQDSEIQENRDRVNEIVDKLNLPKSVKLEINDQVKRISYTPFKKKDTNTNVFAVVSLIKLAQDIAITLLKLEFEGVQVTEAMNSKIARAEPCLSPDESGLENSEHHKSNSIKSNPHLSEDEVF